MDDRPRDTDTIMENQASFNLNQKLRAWRENLGQSPALHSENLNELESHLRDSISRLQAAGLSGEEAFLIAVRRVGSEGALGEEFGKVNRRAVWMDHLFWMLIGTQLWWLVVGFGSAASRSLAELLMGRLHDVIPDSHRVGIFAAVAVLFHLLALAGGLTFCWWLVVRKGEAIGRWLGRLSRRKTLLVIVGAFIGGYVLLRLSFAGSNMLLAGIEANRPVYYDVIRAQSRSFMWGDPAQTVTLLILVLLLARKRLASGKAA